MKNEGYAKFGGGGGGDKVHYGICASGLFTRLRRHVEQNSDKGIFKRET